MGFQTNFLQGIGFSFVAANVELTFSRSEEDKQVQRQTATKQLKRHCKKTAPGSMERTTSTNHNNNNRADCWKNYWHAYTIAFSLLYSSCRVRKWFLDCILTQNYIASAIYHRRTHFNLFMCVHGNSHSKYGNGNASISKRRSQTNNIMHVKKVAAAPTATVILEFSRQ